MNRPIVSYQPRHSPDHESTGWPAGIPYIIGNEGCERFTYYGMRSILTLYLAEVLYAAHPAFRDAPAAKATEHYHLFVAAAYASGSGRSDRFHSAACWSGVNEA